MSDSIKRYDMDSGYTPGTSMQVYTHGDYVRYEDHLAALQRAKDEAREEAAAECDKMVAHCEQYGNSNAADYCHDCSKWIREQKGK